MFSKEPMKLKGQRVFKGFWGTKKIEALRAEEILKTSFRSSNKDQGVLGFGGTKKI